MSTSQEERDVGLSHIERIRREQLGHVPVPEPEPEPQPDPFGEERAHAEDCPYCAHLRCWACEYQGLPLNDCRHDDSARHGGGDLTNPPPPEPEEPSAE